MKGFHLSKTTHEDCGHQIGNGQMQGRQGQPCQVCCDHPDWGDDATGCCPSCGYAFKTIDCGHQVYWHSIEKPCKECCEHLNYKPEIELYCQDCNHLDEMDRALECGHKVNWFLFNEPCRTCCEHKDYKSWEMYCPDCEDLMTHLTPGGFHKMEGFPWDNKDAAIAAAVLQAKKDIEDGVFRWLGCGGPMPPWVGPMQDYLTRVGIVVEAVAACEIWNYEIEYLEIYTAYTRTQVDKLGRSKDMLINDCSKLNEFGEQYVEFYEADYKKLLEESNG